LILRPHGNLRGEPLGARESKGRCETGWGYERRLRLRNEDGRVAAVRRSAAALDKPTRDGATESHILTNRPAQKVPAGKVTEVYRQRGTVEGLSFEVAPTRACAIDTLCYPKAARFAFCLGLRACKAVALRKAALRAAPGAAGVGQQWSASYAVLEIRQTSAGMMVAIPPACWSVFQGSRGAAGARVLKGRARQVSIHRYRKTARGPKEPRPQRRRDKSGEHVATSRIIAGRKRR
jgi:hypothetical protein